MAAGEVTAELRLSNINQKRNKKNPFPVGGLIASFFFGKVKNV